MSSLLDEWDRIVHPKPTFFCSQPLLFHSTFPIINPLRNVLEGECCHRQMSFAFRGMRLQIHCKVRLDCLPPACSWDTRATHERGVLRSLCTRRIFCFHIAPRSECARGSPLYKCSRIFHVHMQRYIIMRVNLHIPGP